jgi:hypothetical protein
VRACGALQAARPSRADGGLPSVPRARDRACVDNHHSRVDDTGVMHWFGGSVGLVAPRCRCTSPDDASIGAVPLLAAKCPAVRNRPRSPTIARMVAAPMSPIPRIAVRWSRARRGPHAAGFRWRGMRRSHPRQSCSSCLAISRRAASTAVAGRSCGFSDRQTACWWPAPARNSLRWHPLRAWEVHPRPQPDDLMTARAAQAGARVPRLAAITAACG